MTGLAAGPAPETVVRAVAALAVGATAIVAAALPLAAAADRRASRAAAVWRGAFAALALLLPLALLSPRAPGAPMWVAVPHAPLVAAWELGPVAMSLGGWALALWVVGAAGLLARLAADIRAARALQLPTDVDGDRIQASYEHGLLRIAIPKAETARPRRIEIAGTKDARRLGA